MLIVEEFQAKQKKQKSLGRDLKESNQFNAPISNRRDKYYYSIRTAVSQSRPNICAQLSRYRPLHKTL